MANLIGLKGNYVGVDRRDISYALLFTDSRLSHDVCEKTTLEAENQLKIHMVGDTLVAASGYNIITQTAIRNVQIKHNYKPSFSPMEQILSDIDAETLKKLKDNPGLPFPNYFVSGFDFRKALSLYSLDKNGRKPKFCVGLEYLEKFLSNFSDDETLFDGRGLKTNILVSLVMAFLGSETARRNDPAVNGNYQIGIVTSDGIQTEKSLLIPPETNFDDFSKDIYLTTMAGYDINNLHSHPIKIVANEMRVIEPILSNFYRVFMESLRDFSLKVEESIKKGIESKTRTFLEENFESKARISEGIDALLLGGRNNLIEFLEKHAHRLPSNVQQFPL